MKINNYNLSNSPFMELENQIDGIPAGEQPKTISEEEYKSLQAEYTRNRQARITELTELVKVKPEALASISDKKLQDAVTKQIYGYDTYDTFVAVEGYDPNKEDEDDDITILKKRVKQIEYVSKQKELDDAIEVYKIQNPSLFKSPDSENLLREKLGIISSTIPTKERIATAASIAFGSINDPSSVAYKALISASVKPTSASVKPETERKDKNVEGILNFLGIKKE